jgi:hypothetical protein
VLGSAANGTHGATREIAIDRMRARTSLAASWEEMITDRGLRCSRRRRPATDDRIRVRGG